LLSNFPLLLPVLSLYPFLCAPTSPTCRLIPAPREAPAIAPRTRSENGDLISWELLNTPMVSLRTVKFSLFDTITEQQNLNKQFNLFLIPSSSPLPHLRSRLPLPGLHAHPAAKRDGPPDDGGEEVLAEDNCSGKRLLQGGYLTLFYIHWLPSLVTLYFIALCFLTFIGYLIMF